MGSGSLWRYGFRVNLGFGVHSLMGALEVWELDG